MPIDPQQYVFRRPIQSLPFGSGFTLLELLIAIGVLGVLMSVVLVAVNPSQQFSLTRNVKRTSDAKTLLNALYQRSIDPGSIPGFDATSRMVGTASNGCDIQCGNSSSMSPAIATLAPTADSYLDQGSQSSNFGSSQQLWVYPWSSSNTKRAILRFDVSGIPSSATVTDAQLYLHEAATYGMSRTISAHRVTRNWNVSQVTWAVAQMATSSSSSSSATPWSTLGGDYVGSATATTTLTWDGMLGWDSWNVTPDVLAFVQGTQQNYGWILKDAVEDSSQHYWYFDSAEASNPSNRPYLRVTYTPAPPTLPSACLNLSSLVPTYLPSLPVDPTVGSQARTYFAIKKMTNGRIAVRACAAEGDKKVELER